MSKKRVKKDEVNRWLIISYLANMDGVSTAQWVDDRLPWLQRSGVDFNLLSSPCGPHFKGLFHLRVPSISPEGMKYELGFISRRVAPEKAGLRVFYSILLAILSPFCFLENKIWGSGGAHLSWSFMAVVAGFWICLSRKPTTIYATGGATSAHIAAVILSFLTRIPYVAEFQDPFVAPWAGRNKHFKRAQTYLENVIYDTATRVVYCTKSARDSAERRQNSGKSVSIYAGASPKAVPSGTYIRNSVCQFGYFGALYNSRNLNSFLAALELLIAEKPVVVTQSSVEIYGDVYGNDIQRKIEQFPYDIVTCHGRVPRTLAVETAAKTDVLLLVQHVDECSSETIPAKVYEYLLTQRPILGLVYHNDELKQMLESHGHIAVPADNPHEIKKAILHYFEQWENDELSCAQYTPSDLTVEKAVQELIACASQG